MQIRAFGDRLKPIAYGQSSAVVAGPTYTSATPPWKLMSDSTIAALVLRLISHPERDFSTDGHTGTMPLVVFAQR
jgi:hypothetical protein